MGRIAVLLEGHCFCQFHMHLEVDFELFLERYQALQYKTYNKFIVGMSYSSFFQYEPIFYQPLVPAITVGNLYPINPSYQWPSSGITLYLPEGHFPMGSSNFLPLDNLKENTSSHPKQIHETHKIQQINKRDQTSDPIIKYAKKNAESNVINQVFSFLSIRAKSKKVLALLLRNDEELMNIYYQIMKQLKKRNKKYINRCYLKQLIEFEEDHMGRSLLGKVDANHRLSIDLFRKILRVLVNFYLKNVCISTILTSAKLDRSTKYEHLQRKNEISIYLNYHIQNYAYFKTIQ